MTERMSNAPVYYALAKVSFNPIPAMADPYVARVQDALRQAGFPLFESRQQVQLVIPEPTGGQPPEPKIIHAPSWLMTRQDRTEGFILDQDSITFHTTHYKTHREFIESALLGLETVHKVVTLDFVSRIGMRYLDAVIPREGERVEQYLMPGLHGLSLPQHPIGYTLSESLFATETRPLVSHGTLVHRTYRFYAALGFPPDLQPGNLELNAQFPHDTELPHAIIDTDHFVQGQMQLDMVLLEEQMRSLHSVIKTAFHAAVTKHALSVWS